MRMTYSSCRNREGKDGGHASLGVSSQRGGKIDMRTEKTLCQRLRNWKGSAGQVWHSKQAGSGFGKGVVPGDRNSDVSIFTSKHAYAKLN